MRITVYELTEAQKTIIILLQRTLTLLPILLFHHRATPAYPPILIATLVQSSFLLFAKRISRRIHL